MGMQGRGMRGQSRANTGNKRKRCPHCRRWFYTYNGQVIGLSRHELREGSVICPTRCPNCGGQGMRFSCVHCGYDVLTASL
jgi:hypothetical protein